MSLGGLLAAGWFILANLLGMLPSRDRHWRAAYILMGLGLPIVALVFWQHGMWIGGAVLAVGMWILRWPVIYLGRWMRRLFAQGD